VKKKQRACFQNACIETYEIVIIINEAWKHPFLRVEYNKRAIAVWGWCPLTRNLLDHPDNEARDSQSAAASSNNQQSVAATLNYQSGFANTVLSDILQNIDHDAIWERIRSNQEEGHHAIEAFNDAKKLTAGLVFMSGKACWVLKYCKLLWITKEKEKNKSKQLFSDKMMQTTKGGKHMRQHGLQCLTFPPQVGPCNNYEPWSLILKTKNR